MDRKIIKAIQSFDEHLVWISKRRIINQTKLDQLVSSLVVIAESCEINQAKTEAQANAHSETIHKLMLMLKACGFTEKGIIYLLDETSDDLEEYVTYYQRNENSKPLNFPLVADMFRAETRIKRLLKNTTWN